MHARFIVGILLILCMGLWISSGCNPPPEKPADTTKGPSTSDIQPADDEQPEKEAGYDDPKASEDSFVPSGTDPLTGAAWEKLVGVVETNKGRIKIKFFHDAAPRHIENFVYLARSGFYDGLMFHRYEPGFVIQGGDPSGTGQGGPGYKIPAEINSEYNHVKGAIAAARQGDNVNPEKRSSGSQWYICLETAAHLDGNYTVWGKVIEGMDVVMKLRKGDVMKSITIREKQ